MVLNSSCRNGKDCISLEQIEKIFVEDTDTSTEEPQNMGRLPQKHMYKDLKMDVKQSFEQRAAYHVGENCINLQVKSS